MSHTELTFSELVDWGIMRSYSVFSLCRANLFIICGYVNKK